MMIHKHHYSVSGTKDNNDLEKIKDVLSKHPGVKEIETLTTPPGFSVTVENHPDVESLQRSVSRAGNFTLAEVSNAGIHHHSEPMHDHLHHAVKTKMGTNVGEAQMHDKDHGSMKHEITSPPTLEHKNKVAGHKMDHAGMDHGMIDLGNMKMDHVGHAEHRGHDHAGMINDFKRRFFIVLTLTLPIILLSPMIQHWLGVQWLA